MSPRAIRLRRPAVLSVQEGVFVPERPKGILDEVDRRWEGLCAANPAYFDGRLYHVLGVHRNGHGGCVLHVMDSAYRFFAVQDEDFDLGMRALGAKGITRSGDRVLMGLRSPTVGVYRNLWEFAPGGSICPGDDPSSLIQQELQEETGLAPAHDPTAAAVLFDPVLRCWEIVFRIQAQQNEPTPRTDEYAQLQWCSIDNLPAQLSPIAQQITELL